MDLALQGRVIFVTGSSSGIGRAIAVTFGQEGARVAVTYRGKRVEAEQTAERIREFGGDALVVPFDNKLHLSLLAEVVFTRQRGAFSNGNNHERSYSLHGY